MESSVLDRVMVSHWTSIFYNHWKFCTKVKGKWDINIFYTLTTVSPLSFLLNPSTASPLPSRYPLPKFTPLPLLFFSQCCPPTQAPLPSQRRNHLMENISPLRYQGWESPIADTRCSNYCLYWCLLRVSSECYCQVTVPSLAHKMLFLF